MNVVISITLLLLSFSAVFIACEPLEDQNEEGEGFTPQFGERDLHTEEPEQFPGSCPACKTVVSFVKKKLGRNSSKEKIGQLLNKACNKIKSNLFRSACKTIIRKYKDKLIDAIANRGSARSVCVKLKMCKKSSPVS